MSLVAGNHEGVITVAAAQRIDARSAIKRVAAITTTQAVGASASTKIIGKARADDAVGTAPAIDKSEAGDRTEAAQIECVGSSITDNTVTVALPCLNRRGRGVEAGKRDIARAGHQNAVGSGPTIHRIVLSFVAGNHKGVGIVAAIQHVGTRPTIERVVTVTAVQGVDWRPQAEVIRKA